MKEIGVLLTKGKCTLTLHLALHETLDDDTFAEESSNIDEI